MKFFRFSVSHYMCANFLFSERIALLYTAYPCLSCLLSLSSSYMYLAFKVPSIVHVKSTGALQRQHMDGLYYALPVL